MLCFQKCRISSCESASRHAAGIGPEVTDVVTKVVDILGAPIVWERCVSTL